MASSALTLAVTPMVILLVHLLQQTFTIDDKYLPIVSLAVSLVLVLIYVMSTTGLQVPDIWLYTVATITIGTSASGVYSWGMAIKHA